MAANMYRVGDYVYFETSSSSPYLIRRIEELNKTPNGNVEAKVMCFYRRRDVPNSLMLLADKHHAQLEEERETNEQLSEKQLHQLKHRELFLSRQVETLPATHIRGKCSVTLLNETESLLSYLNKDDTFYYSLVYDPHQRTLLADKGEIRVGSRYQADPTPMLDLEEESDGRDLKELENLVWTPETGLCDKEVDQFMVVARSVGTFARALDCTSTVRQPSLHMSAAAASRDVTLFHAMDTLHNHKYDISKAISSLVPPGGPVLCRDEMEEWSASEANLFEEALDKYGKDFNDIRQDFLPWKTLKSIVEYYYMWKTTDRYVQQKRIKAAEAESKLKQVYIPNYNKPNPAAISNKLISEMTARTCESCFAAATTQWYAWGPVHMQCRLCASCWGYWKKQGGLKMPTRLDGERPGPNQRTERLQQQSTMRTHKCTISGCGKEFKLKTHLARHLATAHNLTIRSGSPRPVMKTRAAFCLITTPLTRISRFVCRDILKMMRAARNPTIPINIATIKQECQTRLPSMLDKLPKIVEHKYTPMIKVLARLGTPEDHPIGELLTKTPSTKIPPPHAYPALTMEEIIARRTKLDDEQRQAELSRTSSSIMRKRGFEETNGVNGGSPAKKMTMGPMRHVSGAIRNNIVQRAMLHHHMNGRSGRYARKQILSWVDAPDDVYFIATDNTRKVRKQLNAQDFKRAARKPWRKLNVKTPGINNVPKPVPVPVPVPAASEDVVVLD